MVTIRRATSVLLNSVFILQFTGQKSAFLNIMLFLKFYLCLFVCPLVI